MDHPSSSPGDAPPTANKTNLRERNKAEKLIRIKESAKRLFTQRGFDATTTKQIADEAGVAAGTIFLYAKTKDEILFMIFEDEITRIHEEGFAKITPDLSPAKGAEVVFADLLRYYGTGPELARSYVRRFVFIDSSMSERYAAMQKSLFDQLGGLVTRSQSRAEIRSDFEPSMIVRNLWGIYVTSLVLLLRNDPIDVGSALRYLTLSMELIESGLKPRHS